MNGVFNMISQTAISKSSPAFEEKRGEMKRGCVEEACACLSACGKFGFNRFLRGEQRLIERMKKFALKGN